ncbi:MAG: hypothetical protein CMK32_07725 [Porticoccaceae bacterium]|nr:hypothetical protein [Porticoccaceae bacterium]
MVVFISCAQSTPVDLTICPLCDRHSSDIASRRLNTNYCDDRLNFQTSCGECYDRSIEYYQDLWDEYNRSRF